MNEEKVCQKIIEIAKLLNQKQYLAAADGNISARMGENLIFITPRGRNKIFLNTSDICQIDLSGEPLKGAPSTESLMHLAVFQNCPGAKWVVHAHPPTAIAWSISHPNSDELPTDALPEVILGVGRIPIVPYAKPGTPDIAAAISNVIGAHRAVILGHHGAISWGETSEEAYNGIERIEHAALVLSRAATFGGAESLPAEALTWLRHKRAGQGSYNL